MASDSAISTIRVNHNAAKISVWWDLEECEVPKGSDAEVIVQNIKTALMNMSYCGPVSFSVYADTARVPSLVRKAFKTTGISLSHVSAGLKSIRDNKMFADMLSWAENNPAPANYLLISGKKKFFDALKQFDMRGYNILLVQPENASDALFPGVNSIWNWTSLLSGGFPVSSGEFHPKMDAFEMNQTTLPDPEKGPAEQFNKWAPHVLFQVNKSKNPATPIPNLLPQAQNSDLLENIDRFNDRLRRQKRIKNDEPEKKFSFKNRNKEENSQHLSEYKSTGVCVALHYLREEMMIPSKENIRDMVRYGDLGDQNFDVEEALEMELEHDMIVQQNLGDMSLYLPRNWELWECVNPDGGYEGQYSKATWDLVQNYLSSLNGRIEMILSDCRYEASLKLKNSCLRKFCLGRVQRIMNIIVAKGWIFPFPDGWKPVSITLARRE